jgi:hypothetical protein
VTPRTREAVLWGLVGGLSFLVLAQGYRLVASLGVDTLGLLGLGSVVAVTTTLLSYVAAPRLARRGGNEQR